MVGKDERFWIGYWEKQTVEFLLSFGCVIHNSWGCQSPLNFDAPRRPYGSTMDLVVKKKGLHINGRAQRILPGLKMDGILCLGATAS